MKADKKSPEPAPPTSNFERRQTIIEEESRQDGRTLKIAIAVAVALHLGLFAVNFPELSADTAPEPEKEEKVYVVQQIKLKPPPPPPQQQEPPPPPKKKAKKIPIPDPTPEEPEPIPREPEPIPEPEIDMPDIEVEFEIPDAPPAPEPDPVVEAPPAPEPEPEPEGPIQVGGDVNAPVKVSGQEPRYPETARQARVSGVVIVQSVIDKQGNVKDVKVLKGLPMGLDKAAVDAVKSWKFEPATLNGKPVEVYYNLTVQFSLQ